MKTALRFAAALGLLAIVAPTPAAALKLPSCTADCFQEYNFCLNNCSIYNGSCPQCVVSYNACLSGCAPSQAATTPDVLANPVESAAAKSCAPQSPAAE